MDILEGKKMIEEKKKIFMYWQSFNFSQFLSQQKLQYEFILILMSNTDMDKQNLGFPLNH